MSKKIQTQQVTSVAKKSKSIIAKLNNLAKTKSEIFKAIKNKAFKDLLKDTTIAKWYSEIKADENFKATKVEALSLATYCAFCEWIFNEDPRNLSPITHLIMIVVINAFLAIEKRIINLATSIKTEKEVVKFMSKAIRILAKAATRLFFINQTALVWIYFKIPSKISTMKLAAVIGGVTLAFIGIASRNIKVTAIATAIVTVLTTVGKFLITKITESMREGKLRIIRKVMIFISLSWLVIATFIDIKYGEGFLGKLKFFFNLAFVRALG